VRSKGPKVQERSVANQACLAEAALRRRRAGRFCVFGALAVAGVVSGPRAAAQGERLELSCGAISRQTTPAALKATYGADNVKDVVSADGQAVALLFPDNPEKRIEVVWTDAGRETLASFMTWDRKSAWKTPQGLKMGQAIADVADLNGRPFVLRGFSQPDAGAVTSWMSGKLAELDSGACHVAVRLTPPTDITFSTLDWRLAEIVQDAVEVSSDDRRIKPYKAAVSGLGLEWR
jgi:hypothetical protein